MCAWHACVECDAGFVGQHQCFLLNNVLCAGSKQCEPMEGAEKRGRHETFGWLKTKHAATFWVIWRGLGAHAGRPVKSVLH